MEEILYTPAQAIEAIDARIKGIWDNPHLEKLGPLGITICDINRIIEATNHKINR